MVFNAPHLFQQFGLFGEIRVGFKGSFQSVEEGAAERAESLLPGCTFGFVMVVFWRLHGRNDVP